MEPDDAMESDDAEDEGMSSPHVIVSVPVDDQLRETLQAYLGLDRPGSDEDVVEWVEEEVLVEAIRELCSWATKRAARGTRVKPTKKRANARGEKP